MRSRREDLATARRLQRCTHENQKPVRRRRKASPSEAGHTVSLTHGQRYALRELGIIFRTAEDEELKAQINILEKAFRSTRLSHAVKREVNLCRRNAVTGANLVKELGRIYLQHNLREAIERQRLESEDRPVSQILCSEALV